MEKVNDETKRCESSDSSDQALKIDETPKKKGKHKDFDASKLDKTIEETIRKCENFTPDVAKKMLLKLIKNEHILALSFLKAEEDEVQGSDSDEDDKKSEAEAPSTPKLTRLKAKQLNHKLPVPRNLNTPEPCKEVVDLIQGEMKSDDEDEEYQPCEEEAVSDEDATNTTFSDLESQPSTPGSALLYNEQDFESPVKDGSEFKVPKTRTLSAEEQENISRRTRSKLCLQTTAIETIESTFVPPDITTDMYDFDQDHEIDNEWREFLSEFMMPLTNSEDFLDDEKSDPEYVAMEAAPIDKEELRPVRVSKKELNQLISELLEDSCNSLTFDPEPSTSKRSGSDSQSNKSKRPKHSSPTRNKTQSPKTSKVFTADGMLNTPPLRQGPKSVETTPKPRQDELFLAPYFQTPQRMGFTTPTVGLSPAPYLPVAIATPPPVTLAIPESPKISQITGVYSSEHSSIAALPPILIINAQNQLELCSTSTLITQAFNSANGIVQLPQFQSVVIQVPTIDLLQNRLNLSSVITSAPGDQVFLPEVSMQSPNIHVISDVQVTLPHSQNHTQDSSSEIQNPSLDIKGSSLNPQNPSSDPQNSSSDPKTSSSNKTNLTDDKKRKLCLKKLKVFEYLETEPPPAEKVFDENLRGFSAEQKEIYEQQMRMHAQFLSQNYLQVYPSPKWWDKAEGIKKDLEEIKNVVKPETSPHTAKHIKECLMMCENWAKELEEDNERNKRFAEFMHTEAEFDQRSMNTKSKFLGRFHNRLMEHALSSKAIMYPHLLPHQPFRARTFMQIDTTHGELTLIAIGLQRYHQEASEKLNKLFPSKPREPKMSRVIASLVRELKSFRKVSEMDNFVNKYKSDPRMNPIKYYFIHKKAPAVKHVIEDVDIEKPKPPKMLRRGLLPKVWSTYMFSYDRLQLYPYEPEDEERVIELADEDKIDEESSPDIEELPVIQEQQIFAIDNSYQLEFTFDGIPKINICVLPSVEPLKSSPALLEEFESPEKVSCFSLLSPERVLEKSIEEKQNNLISILKKVSDNLVKSPVKKKSVNFILPNPTPTRSSSRLNNKAKQIGHDFVLTQKFFIIVENFFSNYVKNLKFRSDPHPVLLRIFNWTKTIDIYGKLLQKSLMMSKKRQNESTAEASTKTKKNMSTSEEYSKKLHRKIADNRNLIMQTSRNKCTIEKDCSYAYNYLERAKKTMTENGDDELYSEFMTMLTSFDPEFESVPELYNKIEPLLMPNYSDLLDLFLTFLLPEHATEIGKFFEHFLLENMKNLLQKLNIFFAKQPSHMKKIYACLNEMSNEKDLTMEKLKAKILPLLKGNQLLIDWFLELFSKPPESVLPEFESIYIKKSLSDSDNSIDNYEEIHSKDLIECKNVDELNTCGVKYKNGKIMYHHGTLLPAKISFLAHDAPSVMSLKKDEENSLCVHEIRNHIKFNDPKRTEEPEISKRSSRKHKKFKLCDVQTLHAHAVRLNPVHAQPGEKIADLIHLLTPPPAALGSSEEKNSPKKSKNCKKSPKKVAVNKSPSSSSGNSMTLSPPSSSKALQTAKKLRTLVDEVDEPIKKKQKTAEDLTKVAPPSKVAEKSVINPQPSKPEELLTEMPPTSTNPDENLKSDDQKRGTGGWTREEDKIILEEFKIGYDSKEILIDALMKKLNRSRSEILERYEFLLDILLMIKN